MAFGFPSKKSRGVVGLDLDGSYVAAVAASGRRVTAAASADLPAGVVVDGEVADAEALAEQLKDLFRGARLPKRVRLGVSNQQIVVRHLELPVIEERKELDAAVRFQAAEAIAMPLEETVLDHQVVGRTATPDGSPRLRVLVVAAREAMIERFVDAVRGAGLRPEGIDLNAFALVRALGPGADAAPAEDESEPATVYCHLGGVTNLAVAVGTSCLFTRPLSAAWSDGGDDAAALLVEEIRLSIDYYMAQADARAVGKVLLSGPGAAREGFADELAAMLHLPVEVAPPLGALDASALPGDEDPYRHTVAAGLALGAEA